MRVFFVVAGMAACSPSPVCADLDEASCVADAACIAASGGPIADDDCDSTAGTSVFLGCIDDPGGCDEAFTLASDPDGDLYLFPDSCIPDDFTEESCVASGG